VADDDHDVVGVEGGDGGEHMAEKSATRDLMEDLRGRRTHPGSCAGGEDDDGGRARAAHAGGLLSGCGGRGALTIPPVHLPVSRPPGSADDRAGEGPRAAARIAGFRLQNYGSGQQLETTQAGQLVKRAL
jgi:hypothetical protein